MNEKEITETFDNLEAFVSGESVNVLIVTVEDIANDLMANDSDLTESDALELAREQVNE